MEITHDSRDLLVIHSSGATAKVIGGIIAGFGVLLCVLTAVALLEELMDEVPIVDAVLQAIFVAAGGLVIGGLGVVVFLLAKDTDYRFSGTQMQLIVRWRRGAFAVPFARIVKAETFDGGEDSVGYGLRLKLRDPSEMLDMTDYLKRDDTQPKMLAARINRFLKMYQDEYDDVSIDLADMDVATMAKGILNNLWGGAPSKLPGAQTAPAQHDGPVLFVCPECGWQTDQPVGPPPYECGRCSADGDVVHLQDRTPGRALVVPCGCGASFSVPMSFAGMVRSCPSCGKKCPIPQKPAPRKENG
jgi:hypothetical protein